MNPEKKIPENADELFLVYSESETSMNREPMFWSNHEGWGDLGRATKFTAAECAQFTLPQSVGYDARWVRYTHAKTIGTVEAAHERDLLAKGIRDAIVKAGLCAEDVPLTGPHLLLLLDNLADQVALGVSSGNVYTYEFKCACPVNKEEIAYTLVIESQSMIPVERITQLADSFSEAYHEDLANEFYRNLGGTQRLTAFHHGVHIKTLRNGK